MLFALFALKPLVTALCLGGGAAGGLFTPTLSTGAVLGGFLGLAWSLAWPGSSIGAYAMVGAAAMIGASMQAPLTALALVLELTHSGFQIMVPMMAATVTATAVARHIDGYSIYSAGCQLRRSRPQSSVGGQSRIQYKHTERRQSRPDDRSETTVVCACQQPAHAVNDGLM